MLYCIVKADQEYSHISNGTLKIKKQKKLGRMGIIEAKNIDLTVIFLS